MNKEENNLKDNKKVQELKKRDKLKNNRKMKIMLIIFAAIIIIGVLIFQYLIRTNEDIEAKIIGSTMGVNWSEEVEVSTESLEAFEKKMKENFNKHNENIVIMHQYNGCGACFEEILNELKSKNYKNKNLNIVLVTTMHEDDIKSMYGEEIKDLDVFSDFEYQIGKKLKVFNDLENENEDVVIYMKDSYENKEEYYFEESSEVFEYINSKIKK